MIPEVIARSSGLLLSESIFIGVSSIKFAQSATRMAKAFGDPLPERGETWI
jgi:hypothetical protein